jgi:hypothetical protein
LARAVRFVDFFAVFLADFFAVFLADFLAVDFFAADLEDRLVDFLAARFVAMLVSLLVKIMPTPNDITL